MATCLSWVVLMMALCDCSASVWSLLCLLMLILGLTSEHPSIKCSAFTLNFVLISALSCSAWQWNSRHKRLLNIRYSLQHQVYFVVCNEVIMGVWVTNPLGAKQFIKHIEFSNIFSSVRLNMIAVILMQSEKCLFKLCMDSVCLEVFVRVMCRQFVSFEVFVWVMCRQ